MVDAILSAHLSSKAVTSDQSKDPNIWMLENIFPTQSSARCMQFAPRTFAQLTTMEMRGGRLVASTALSRWGD